MMPDIEQQKYIIGRVIWLIKMRWIASAGVVGTIFAAEQFIPVSIQPFPLYCLAACLVIYNIILYILVSSKKYNLFKDPSMGNVLANLQITIDLTLLAALIHFSGGIENPFIFYFIFHMIIASILLSRRAAFLQATYAAVLFFLIVSMEQSGLLSHYCLKMFPCVSQNQGIYIFAVLFVFVSTLYIAVYLTSSVSDQLRQRGKRLRAANRLLNEKDRIKSKYVLSVTHDIKEDLAAIHSCIEPVTTGIMGSLDKGQADLLQRAKMRSSKLISYVNALLEITKLKLTKKLEMEYFDFSEVIREISEHIALKAQDKQISFNVAMASDINMMKGVRIYIYETVLNLLMNSIKYTQEGGKIDLQIMRNKENLLSIVIRDTGIGIPDNSLHHVFEEFYRAENAKKREPQGTGLGLAMAKHVIEMHNGRIWIESEEGKGTNVFIELPLFIQNICLQ